MAYKSTWVESDADDEFEQSAPQISHTVLPNLSPTTSDDMEDTINTPSGSHASPTGLISSWSSVQCAEYVKSLGLGQYADAMIDEAIDGEALISMQHEELKEMGITSVGHRLTLLKSVYETKVKQNVPIDQDDYVPLSAEADSKEMNATQEDIGRIIESIRLRDQRIIAAESDLRAIKEDLNRLIEENRKLREETLPIIRMAKDRSHPLPNPEQPLTTPPPDGKLDKSHIGSGLSRKFSTKRLNLGSTPKNTSPTINQPTILESPPHDSSTNTSSSHLATGQPSPGMPQASPTSPAYSINTASTATPRPFPRSNPDDTHYSSGTSLTVPSSRPDKRSTTATEDSSVEIFKSFRVSIEDPCHKVLPVALKRYNIADDWRQYALYIVHGDQERCLGLEEKPLLLFKQLDKEGRKPMFMLRKHASPAGEGWSGPQGGSGGEARGLPGGVL